MKDIPDIVKELKGEEKLGLFHSKMQDTYEELVVNEEESENIPGTTMRFQKNETKNERNDEEYLSNSNLDQPYKTIFEQSPEAIVVVNKSGTVLNANKRTKEWLGYNPEEIIGKKILKIPFIPDKSKSTIKKNFIKRMLGKKISPYEIDFLTKNGEVKVGRIHGTPLRDHKNKIIGDLIMVSDVSEKKVIEDELKESESRFRSIFENSAIAITFTDENERIISWNKFAEDLLGSKDLYMKPVKSIYPPGEWNKIRSQNIRENGIKHHLETKLLGENNKIIDVEISLSVLKDKKGKVTGSIGVIKDISERKQAQEKLMENEEKFRDLFENASDLIQAVNSDGSFLYVNCSWKKTLGYSEDEIKNITVFDIIHPESKEHCMEIFKRIMSGENIDHVETSFVSKGGNVITVEGRINCRFKDGKPVSTRGIFRDVTEHKKFEETLKEKIEELEESEAVSHKITEALNKTLEKLEKSQKIIKQKNVKLERLNEIKSAFLNVTSHELRTPMSAIKGYMQMMIRGKLGDITEDQKNALAVVLRNAERLDHLIQDILDISRLESGTMKFIPYDTDIGMLIEETAETMLSSAAV